MSSTSFSSAVLAAAAFLLYPATAHAHFHISAPPSPTPWMSQTADGSPQKQGPCGNEGGGTATGAVTAFQPGQTVQLEWTETVPHDGWYRIAISYNNRTDLVNPDVTIDGSGLSSNASMEATPVLPVLVDGLFQHNAADISAGKTWTTSVTLPTTPCAKCTLQIIQFMNHHGSNLGNLPDGTPNPDGYFYHHCMDISIGGNGGTDAGAPPPGTDASAGSSSSSGSSGAVAMDASAGGTGSSSSGASSSSSSSSGSDGVGSSGGGSPAGSSSGSGSGGSGTGVEEGGTSNGAGGSSGSGTAAGGSGGADGSVEPMMSAKGGCSSSGGTVPPVALALFGIIAVGGLARRRRS